MFAFYSGFADTAPHPNICKETSYLHFQIHTFANFCLLLQLEKFFFANLHYQKYSITFATKLHQQTHFFSMDIVSRLKVFMDAKRIPVTQFADNCRIPRPSMSQLLSGRNKKVSDEVITKIHDAYPDLSVLWLMFGEGDMENGVKNEISEPQIGAQNKDFPRQTLDFQPVERRIDFDIDDTEENAEKSAQKRDNSVISEAQNHPSKTPLSDTPHTATPSPSGSNPTPNNANAPTARQAAPTTLTLHTDDKQGKRVIGIVVYYNDNSYESFVPDNSGKAPF